jgi:hypothetical protein
VSGCKNRGDIAVAGMPQLHFLFWKSSSYFSFFFVVYHPGIRVI